MSDTEEAKEQTKSGKLDNQPDEEFKLESNEHNEDDDSFRTPRLEDQICPNCHTSKHHDPQMVLYVGTCSHSLCKRCLDSQFKQDQGKCPTCSVDLRKRYFKPQMFDDPRLDRATDIRRMLVKRYYLIEEDFDTCDEYYEYVDEFEEIYYNLVENIDKEETKNRLDNFRLKYAIFIAFIVVFNVRVKGLVQGFVQ
ncbi:hypothetical protein ACOME3_005025 [Neoechinorhynchus agilis]